MRAARLVMFVNFRCLDYRVDDGAMVVTQKTAFFTLKSVTTTLSSFWPHAMHLSVWTFEVSRIQRIRNSNVELGRAFLLKVRNRTTSTSASNVQRTPWTSMMRRVRRNVRVSTFDSSDALTGRASNCESNLDGGEFCVGVGLSKFDVLEQFENGGGTRLLAQFSRIANKKSKDRPKCTH